MAYDPATAGFCTYLVPGNDNEVIGIATTGSGKNMVVWFIESDFVGSHPALASFLPSKVGESCPNSYSLAQAASFKTIPWPRPDFPGLVSADPSATALWVGDVFGNAVEKVDPATRTIVPYLFPSQNAYSVHGSEPWQGPPTAATCTPFVMATARSSA